jgi:hypothetical protein
MRLGRRAASGQPNRRPPDQGEPRVPQPGLSHVPGPLFAGASENDPSTIDNQGREGLGHHPLAARIANALEIAAQ